MTKRQTVCEAKRTARWSRTAAAVAGVAALVLSATVYAQDGTPSVWDGVYTDEQATRGEVRYEQECATCHLADLLGDGIAPALTGAAFDFRWSDLSVGDMFVSLRATMPQGAPASLSPQGYADIVGYILKRNDFPAGSNELPTDETTLNTIIIHAEPPAGSASAQAEGYAGDGMTVWDGVFTAAQAQRGETTYEQECATCHLADLLGDGIAPAPDRRGVRLSLERPVGRRHVRRPPRDHAPGRTGKSQPSGIRRHRELPAAEKRLTGRRQRATGRRSRPQHDHHHVGTVAGQAPADSVGGTGRGACAVASSPASSPGKWIPRRCSLRVYTLYGDMRWDT